MARIAVVLFNLGGPDKSEAVRPFLFNLFNDPAIISLPNPFRFLLAQLISRKRAPLAKEIYHHLGGGSPILPLTEKQAHALEKKLSEIKPDDTVKTFIAMRYWHPFTHETARQVKDFAPDHIILLPLYPQFSTTTTDSSLNLWKKEAKKQHLATETKIIGCYPTQAGFIQAQAALLKEHYAKTTSGSKPRVLFSAHGLPKKIVEKGDPYQWQVEQTAKAVADAASIPDPDWVVCYQSKVGPLEWLEPSTEHEIKRAGEEKIPLVVVPIAFVSEHSETLVELDIEYKQLAENSGVPEYIRVPALGDHPQFIEALAVMCRESMNRDNPHTSSEGRRLCPEGFSQCLCD